MDTHHPGGCVAIIWIPIIQVGVAIICISIIQVGGAIIWISIIQVGVAIICISIIQVGGPSYGYLSSRWVWLSYGYPS